MEDRNNTRPVLAAMDEVRRSRAAVLFELDRQGTRPVDVGMASVSIDELNALFKSMARAAVLYRAYDGLEPSGRRLQVWNEYRGYCSGFAFWAQGEYIDQCSLNGWTIDGVRRATLDGFGYMGDLFRSWPLFDFTMGDEPAIITQAAARPVRKICVIHTDKTRNELERIFSELVEGGYIADGACGALEDFMMAFDDMATEQGRIVWIKQGKNRQLNKAALCAFLNLFGIIDNDKIQAFSRAIFGVDLNSSNVSRDSAERDRLKAIIDG